MWFWLIMHYVSALICKWLHSPLKNAAILWNHHHPEFLIRWYLFVVHRRCTFVKLQFCLKYQQVICAHKIYYLHKPARTSRTTFTIFVSIRFIQFMYYFFTIYNWLKILFTSALECSRIRTERAKSARLQKGTICFISFHLTWVMFFHWLSMPLISSGETCISSMKSIKGS